MAEPGVFRHAPSTSRGDHHVLHAQNHRTAERCRGAAGPFDAIPTAKTHFVNGRQLLPPYPAGLEQAVFGLGCFWGAERKFWQLGDGIFVTAVGYAGGHTQKSHL